MKILFVFGGKGNAFFNTHQIFWQKNAFLGKKVGVFDALVCGNFVLCVVVWYAERRKLV